MNCCICNIEYDEKRKLSSHVRTCHKISIKEYYDNYLKKDKNYYAILYDHWHTIRFDIKRIFDEIFLFVIISPDISSIIDTPSA